MKRKKSSLLVALMAFWGLNNALAQQQDSTANKINEQVVTIGTRALQLVEMPRIDAQPSFIDSIIAPPVASYFFKERKAKSFFTPQDIPMARLRIKEPLQKIYRGYVRGGIGTLNTPYLELHFNEIRSRDLTYGVHFKHMSSEGGVDNILTNAWSNNTASIWASKIYRQSKMNFGMDYERNVVHQFGFNALNPLNENVTEDEIRQRFNRIGFNGRFESQYRDSTKVNHQTDLSFKNVTDLFDAAENNFSLSTVVGTYRNKEYFSVAAGVDLNNYNFLNPETDLNKTASNAIIHIKPNAMVKKEKWELNVGLAFFADAGESSTFHFYPQAFFKYRLFNDIFVPYAGIDGGIDRVSFNSLSRENPFVLSNLELRNQNTKFDFYGGFRGTITRQISFNFRAARRRIDNQAFFVNHLDANFRLNQFEMVYDELDLTNLTGELTFLLTDKFTLNATGDIFTYSTKNEFFAWHLPESRLMISGEYVLNERYAFRADVFAMGERKAKSLVEFPDLGPPRDGVYVVTLNPYIDANLGFEYRYTKRISAFANIFNLFDSNYSQYFRYQVQGFRFMMGGSYAF
ncbi:MAG: hypothetical protein ACXITV_04730 [Luteibaculaceae bacterium]